jgi:hypothetical protein
MNTPTRKDLITLALAAMWPVIPAQDRREADTPEAMAALLEQDIADDAEAASAFGIGITAVWRAGYDAGKASWTQPQPLLADGAGV